MVNLNYKRVFLAEMPHTLSRYHRVDAMKRHDRGWLSYYLSRSRFERCAAADKPDGEVSFRMGEEAGSLALFRTPGKSSAETLLWYRE